MFDIIGRDPLQWEVKFDMLGWNVGNYQSNMSVLITEKKALLLIELIKKCSKGVIKFPEVVEAWDKEEQERLEQERNMT